MLLCFVYQESLWFDVHCTCIPLPYMNVQALLVHVGEEHSVNAAYINNKLGNPLLLRKYIHI